MLVEERPGATGTGSDMRSRRRFLQYRHRIVVLFSGRCDAIVVYVQAQRLGQRDGNKLVLDSHDRDKHSFIRSRNMFIGLPLYERHASEHGANREQTGDSSIGRSI